MSREGGKGRIPNSLVAASCAAVLAVYGAGYWRTRDEARRLEEQAQQRRPARTAQAVTAAPALPAPPPMIEPPATAPPSEPPLAAVVPEPAPPAPPPAEEAKPKPAPKKKPPAEKVAAVPKPAEAPALVYSVPLEEPPPKPEGPPPPGPLPEGFIGWVDGTYTGWGTSNHGDIEAKVIIEGGRIVASGIQSCATRYPCDVIDTILHQPIARQNPDVDRVSRATESTDAYYFGLVEALKKAEPPEQPASQP